MLSLTCKQAVLLSIFSIPFAQAQFVSNLPQCVKDCVDQSPDTNCALTDIGCICRASAGNFLPDVITCMHGNCDNELDNNLFLGPLQLACMIAGSPIPASAIRNAQNQASSLALQVTTTVTMGGDSASGGMATTTVTMGGDSASGAMATTTVTQQPASYASGGASTSSGVSVSVSTVTTTTTRSGTTEYLIYPITIQQTQTVTGPTSTLTSISTASPSSGFTGLIPVIIVGTNSAGSTYTSTTSQLGAFSTYTTTDTRGSTTTQTSTYTSTASAQSSGSSTSSSTDSASSDSTGLTTTTVQAAKTSSSRAPSSKASQAADPNATDSAPFKNTNSSKGSRVEGGRLWMICGVVMAWIWT